MHELLYMRIEALYLSSTLWVSGFKRHAYHSRVLSCNRAFSRSRSRSRTLSRMRSQLNQKLTLKLGVKLLT